MRFYCLFLCATVLAAQPSPGQIDGLATTYDGSVLYFHTQMRLSRSGQSNASKIFAADRDGIRLAVNETEGQIYDRRHPGISTDGTVLTYSVQLSCTQCLAQPITSIVTGRKGSGDLAISGRIQVSGDGNRAIVQTPEGRWERVDLSTGSREPVMGVYPRFQISGRIISDNGSVIGDSGTGVSILQPDGSIQAVPNVLRGGRTGSISGDGRTVLYEIPLFDSVPGLPPQQTGPGWFFVDLRSGEHAKLRGFNPVLSHDGNRILMIVQREWNRREVEIVDRGSGQTIPFPTLDGVTSAVLSGDGRIAYALTESGVFRVAVDSGEVQPWALYPPRASLHSLTTNTIVPGSLYQLIAYMRTMTVPEAAIPPLPIEWKGIRVSLNGEFALVQSVGDGHPPFQFPDRTWTLVEFQVPWGFRAPANEVEIQVDVERAPFDYASRYPDESVRERIRPFALRSAGFLALDPPLWYALGRQWSVPAVLALHDDLTTFVDAEHPARKGEVVHVYMVGLGAVDQEVRDGELPPGDPPARPIQAISCAETETVDAKLAEGLVGIYRVSLRVLTAAPKGSQHMLLFCDGGLASRGALPLLPEE